MTFDKIVLMLGSPGRFQLLAGFLLCCIQLPVTFTDHLMKLYVASPPHRCRIQILNGSVVGESEYRPLVQRQGRNFYSSCALYVDPQDHSSGTQPCVHGWEFLTKDDEWTLVKEWSLVCERAYLIHLLPHVYHVGAMSGSILFGFLADHYGRKCPLMTALFINTALGVSLHFLPSFIFFASVYSLQGVFVAGIQSISVILLLETVSFPHHLQAAILLSSFWPLGLLSLSLLSWIIRNWRYIQVAVSAPGIVCIGYFWLLPQSLPWLLTEGKLKEAEGLLMRFSRFNKTPLPQNFRLQLKNFSKSITEYFRPPGSQHSLETVICCTKIRRFTFILYYIWFILSLDSNASPNDVPALKENKYACLFIEGIMDLGMVIILYFFARRFGAKFMQSAMLAFGGLLCIGSASLAYQMTYHAESAGKLSLLSPVLSVIGKAAIRSVVATCFYFSIKVFPTGVRAIGLGSCLFWTRSARIVGPHLASMGSETGDFVPLAIYGVLSVIAGGLTIFLPNMKLRPLPNLAREVEKSVIVDESKKPKVHFSKHSASVFNKPTSSPVLQALHHTNPSYVDEDREKNCQALLELNVRNISTLRSGNSNNPRQSMAETSFGDFDDSAGTSNCNTRSSSAFQEADKEDTESRLTDLEEELAKIWELNDRTKDENIQSNTNSLHDFPSHRGDLREHFCRMNETSF